MSVIAIVGAGNLGGTLAHTIALADFCREIRFIDELVSVATAKALDITQAGPIEHFQTNIVTDQGTGSTLGADIIILAGPASHPESEWNLNNGRTLLRQISNVNRQAVIICAGAKHRQLVDVGISEVGLSRHRILGSAPEAYRAAARALIALRVGCAPSSIALTVLGAPPESAVIPWSQASIGGALLEAQVTPMQRSQFEHHLQSIEPLGPYALASAASLVARTILSRNGKQPCCYVGLDGELGIQNQVMSTSVALDTSGVTHVFEPHLTPHESGKLEAAKND